MKACCVVGCTGPNTPDPVFFEFPSSRLLRKRWLDALDSPVVDERAAVCIRHFTRADYTLECGRARLRARSVPSRRIRQSDDEDSESDDNSSGSESSDSTDDKSHKSGNDAQDDGTMNNDNVENRVVCDDNEINRINNDNSENKVVCDDNEINRKITKDNENAISNHNTGDEKENKSNKIDAVDKGNGKCEVQIENNPRNTGIISKSHDIHTSTDNVNAESCDNRLKNGDNGRSNNDNVNNDIENVYDDNKNVNNDNLNVNNDNEKVNNDNTNKKVQGKKTQCKITAMRAINGRRKFSSNSDSSNTDSVSSSGRPPEPEGSKEDIEQALKHYYIENKKTERQLAAMADVIFAEQEKLAEESKREESTASEPVFIELSVGRAGPAATGHEAAESDCMMVLESVQCDVDPTLLLAAREEDEANMVQVDLADDDDDDEPQAVENKNEDPISLLTSSDEDDVIIQEPKYDLVEVSSADTSEDDMPLVKLVRGARADPDSSKIKYSAQYTKKLITKLLWGRNELYCVQCGFTAGSVAERDRHAASHGAGHRVIQYCQDCGFTTSSKNQMQKHKQKHKNEKRFKCHKCNYSAKHSMSLVYHMKTHKNSGLNEVEVAICGTYEPPPRPRARAPARPRGGRKGERKVSDAEKKYKCATCGYRTNRRSDLKRHRRRIHAGDEDDDEYMP